MITMQLALFWLARAASANSPKPATLSISGLFGFAGLKILTARVQ